MLALKGNQGKGLAKKIKSQSRFPRIGTLYIWYSIKSHSLSLYDDVRELFRSASEQNFKNIEHQFYETVEKGHGRIETRRY